jgi:hypothetical protein
MVSNRAPRFQVRETDFGCTYSAYRPAGDADVHHRTMHWLFPFYTMSPVPKLGSSAMMGATVPIDDEHCMSWGMYRVGDGFVPPFGPPSPSDSNDMGSGSSRPTWGRGNLPNTSDWLGRFRSALTELAEKDFQIDRDLQSRKPPVLQGWTGLVDINTQDESMRWSQGRLTGGIVDRSREHLGTTDAMIIRVRRRLIDAAKALRDHGAAPLGVDTPEVYRVRSGWVVLPKEADWWEASRDLREAFKQEEVPALVR